MVPFEARAGVRPTAGPWFAHARPAILAGGRRSGKAIVRDRGQEKRRRKASLKPARAGELRLWHGSGKPDGGQHSARRYFMQHIN